MLGMRLLLVEWELILLALYPDLMEWMLNNKLLWKKKIVRGIKMVGNKLSLTCEFYHSKKKQ